MTQEEKLSKFYDLSVGSAKTQGDKMISDYRASLEADFQAHKNEKESAVSERMKSEMISLHRELTRELSDSQAEIRRELAGKQRAVKDQIFESVRNKLSEFRKTPEYHNWLFRNVKAAKEFARDDDASLKEELLTNVKTKLSELRKTSESHAWLFKNAKILKDLSAEEDVIIYIDPSDATYTDEIEAACGIKPVVAEESFGGGIRAVICSKKILIDSSFDTLVAEEEEHFRFDGGNLNG